MTDEQEFNEKMSKLIGDMHTGQMRTMQFLLRHWKRGGWQAIVEVMHRAWKLERSKREKLEERVAMLKKIISSSERSGELILGLYDQEMDDKNEFRKKLERVKRERDAWEEIAKRTKAAGGQPFDIVEQLTAELKECKHKLEGETLRAGVEEDTVDRLRRELALLRRKESGENHIELEYPGIDDNPDHVTVGLTHVRAADDLFISYDFGRDGWVIKMRPTYDDEGGITVTDGEPKEVAFVSGWLESDRKRDEDND